MIEAAELALRFVKGRKPEDLLNDDMLRMALLHAVQIVGEAAAKVSDEVKNEAPDIPWSLIVGMRNRLVHGYMEIDDDILWSTVTDRMPALLTSLRAIAGRSGQ